MKFFPVQQVVFKLVEGIPLDDVVMFPVRSCVPSSSGLVWTVEELTEKQYVEKLQREGRCVIPERFSDPDWRAQTVRTVCLVTGRRAGKSTLVAELATAELMRRVVSYDGPGMLGLFTVTTDQSQAKLMLQYMVDAALSRPDVEARLANQTVSGYRFQTDADILRTGSWVGSQRRAAASVKLGSRSAMRIQGAFNGLRLGFLSLDEPDHMLADQAQEAWLALAPCLYGLAGTKLVVGSPGTKGWMRGLFGQPNVLSLHIPAWEMNPCLSAAALEAEYLKNPAVFWVEFGACWAEDVREVRPVDVPAARRPVGTGVSLNELGRLRRAQEDESRSVTTQALVLADKTGTVARLVLGQAHLGVLSPALRDVILTAASLASRLGVDLDAVMPSGPSE